MFSLRETEVLQKNTSQMVAATRLANSAKECILYQLYLAAFRQRKTYRDILTPRQAILYQEWLLSNRDRMKGVLLNGRKRSPASAKLSDWSESQGSEGEWDEDLILEKLCRYLEETLKVSKNLRG